MSKPEPITEATQESDLSPYDRVEALTYYQMRACLQELIVSITKQKDTKGVPDILHRWHLLTQFEVYDADHAWTQLEDEIRQLTRSLG
jgi:hypothetical protein